MKVLVNFYSGDMDVYNTPQFIDVVAEFSEEQ